MSCSDGIYFWAGLTAGASDAFVGKVFPALILTLTTGGIISSLRDQILMRETKPNETMTQKILKAVGETTVDALHVASGLATGACLASAVSKWTGGGNRMTSALMLLGSIGISLASSSGALYARSVVKKIGHC